MADEAVKKMSVKEFRELGYLQELNRQLLHPLGIALEVVVAEDGSESFGGVWDSRDDEEGFVFGEGLIDPSKAKFIYDQMAERSHKRFAALGFVIQPDQ